MITIDFLKKNNWAVIKEIHGGKHLKQKLYGMGIREGDKIFVLQDSRTGPLIIMKDQIKIALGRGMVKKITVTPAENSLENHS